MSWLSGVVDAVSGVFSGGSAANTLLDVGTSLAGSYISGQANKAAAEEIRRGREAAAAATRDANLQAQRRWAEYQEQNAGGLEHLRQLVSQNPYSLTPGQQAGLDDVQRDARASLAASGLRGAGRAGVAAMNAATDNYLNSVYTNNRATQTSAASQLAGNTTTAIQGQNTAGVSAALAGGDAAARNAATTAESDLANAALTGSAIGALTTYLTDDQKSRESRYKDWKNPDV